MKQIRLLTLLALLLTAATGAWAQANSIVINGTPQVGDNSISLTYNFDPANVTGYNYSYYPTLKVKCADDDNTWDEVNLSNGPSSGTKTITLNTLGELQAGKTYKVCFAYNNGGWVDDVFQTFVPAAAGYTVSMKNDVKDADKWTVKLGEGQAQALPIGGLNEGDAVTLQYTGRLKVKGVKATSDAAPAKTPATVTTAPTGAAIVGVGKTTALVSGGVADGGTLWYAVTTTNTKPTSTDGFSDAVPTAQTITASGKVYVWYFVKADDTHTDSEIAATAIEVPVADIVWDVTNVSDLYVSGTLASYEKEGVTLSGISNNLTARCYDFGDPEMDGIAFEIYDSGGFTFTATNGKQFTKIEMTLNGSGGWDVASLGTGWAFNWDYDTYIPTVTWTGSAASTVDLLKGADEFNGAYAKSIAFYLSE